MSHSLGTLWLVRRYWRLTGHAYVKASKLGSGLWDVMLLQTESCGVRWHALGTLLVLSKDVAGPVCLLGTAFIQMIELEIIFSKSWKSHSFVSWEVGCNGLVASSGRMPALSCGRLWMKSPGKTRRCECCLHRGKGYLPGICWLPCNKLETGGVHSSLSPWRAVVGTWGAWSACWLPGFGCCWAPESSGQESEYALYSPQLLPKCPNEVHPKSRRTGIHSAGLAEPDWSCLLAVQKLQSFCSERSCP